MLKIDLHIHTIISGDSYNTFLEFINQAKKLNMDVIGFSEHGINLDMAVTNDIYLKNSRRLPKIIEGVRILKGVEANILNEKGEIDISDETLKTLDYVMAGFHKGVGCEDKGIQINTQTAINVIESGRINIFTHPYVTKIFDIDMEKVAQAACDNDVLLEVDIAYFGALEKYPNTLDNLKKMIEVVKKNGKKVIVNSDSHNIWELGDDSPLDKYKEEIGLTDDMIINNYKEKLFELLGIKE